MNIIQLRFFKFWLLLASCSFHIQAQTEALINRLYEPVMMDSASLPFHNSDQIIHEALSTEDFDTIKELISFFETTDYNPIISKFYWPENGIILALAGDFSSLLRLLKDQDIPDEYFDWVGAGMWSRYELIKDEFDSSWVFQLGKSHSEMIRKRILESQLIEEEKGVLLLYLDRMFSVSEPDFIKNRAETFLTKYPKSEYRNFLRSHVTKEYVANSTNVSLVFSYASMDLGYRSKIEEVEFYEPGGGISVELESEQLHLGGHFMFGTGESITSFEVLGGTWQEGQALGSIYSGFSIGGYPVSSNLFRSSIKLNIGNLRINPIGKDITGAKGNLRFDAFTYGFGASVEIFPIHHWAKKGDNGFYRIGIQFGVDQNFYEFRFRSITGTTNATQFRIGLVINFSKPENRID